MRQWAWLRQAVLLAPIFLAPLSAAGIVLYLTDGVQMAVREYQVLEDRVRYFSVDRNQWEEIPLDLVDLAKTRAAQERADTGRRERAEEERIEREAERQARTELHRVPIDDGVYYADSEQVQPVQQAEITLEEDKSRTILRVFSPIPILSKRTARVAGAQSKFAVHDARPAFYMRLEKIRRLEIVRLKPAGDARAVQVIQTMKESQETFEEHEAVEVFRQQMAPSVYKIWPTAPLPEGEYAVIEYSPGEADVRAWDFSLRLSSPANVEGKTQPKPAQDNP
jgi:hypothetical protein